MFRILIISFFLGVLPLVSRGQECRSLPYREGEKLFFDLSYGWIKGGEGMMQYLTEERDSLRVGVVHAEARTTGIFAWFSRVEDRNRSFFSLQEGYPYRSERTIRRNERVSREELQFLDDNHRVRSSRSGDHLYSEKMYDMLSAFYKARRILAEVPPEEGDVLRLPLFFDGKYFDIRVKCDGKETIRTLSGRQVCYRFVPDTTGNRTFTDPDQLRIWVTDDGRYLPVKIVVRLPVGSFRCVLTGVE